MAEIINGEPSAATIEGHIDTDTPATTLNTTHRSSNGSDHSKVGANETAIDLNTTHRGSDGSDHSLVADTVHDNVAGEIAAISEKASPVNADLVIIEDSADSNNKKKVQVGNLPGGGGFASYFAARRTAAQSIPVNASTKVEFNIEDYDNNTEYDHVTTYGWTCKVAGKYSIGACVGIEGLGDGEALQLLLTKTGPTTMLQDYKKFGGVGVSMVSVQSDIECSVDDVLYVEVKHNMGGNKNTQTNAGCRFWAHQFA